MVHIDTGIGGITVESVETLYQEFSRMDVPDYYEAGEQNPYAGRCKMIPRKASFYVMVSIKNEGKVQIARSIMKGLARRKKVREVICDKHEINFNQFAPAGKIMVLYV